MAEYVSAEVPFIQVGNRRALAHEQILKDENLACFLDRFKHCFDYFPNLDMWVLNEDLYAKITEDVEVA